MQCLTNINQRVERFIGGCLLPINEAVVNRRSGCLVSFRENVQRKTGGCLIKINENVINKTKSKKWWRWRRIAWYDKRVCWKEISKKLYWHSPQFVFDLSYTNYWLDWWWIWCYWIDFFINHHKVIFCVNIRTDWHNISIARFFIFKFS